MNKNLLLAVGFVAVLGARALGTPPTIHVEWADTPPPQQDEDYVIDTTDPDFPNIELRTGRLTWRVWSTDPDNPNEIGDIGIISCPHPDNFAVKLVGDGADAGARHCKGIVLDPQGSGSEANYSNLTAAYLSGDLDGEFFLQRSSGGTGGKLEGGLVIDGSVLGLVRLAEVPGTGTIHVGSIAELGPQEEDVTCDGRSTSGGVPASAWAPSHPAGCPPG